MQFFEHPVVSESESSTDEISILIFNIAHGRGPIASNWKEGGKRKRTRVAQIAELIKKEDADLVILNEVDFCSTWSGHQNQAESIAVEANYAYHAEQRNLDFHFAYGSWVFGNALLSRYPIRDWQLVEYPAVANWEPVLVGQKRGAVLSIEHSSGKIIELVPIHLEHRSRRTRVESVERILKLVTDHRRPPILAGDFNSISTGSTRTTADKKATAMDTLMASGKFLPLRIPSNTDDYTFPSSKPIKTIDWIVVPKQYQLLEYRVVDCSLSDHRPVYAKIKIGSLTGGME